MLLAVMVSFHVQVSQMRSWGNYESSAFLLCPRKKLQTNHHISTPLTPNLSLIIDWIFSFLQKTGKCNPKHWASRSEDEKKENLNLALPHSASSGPRSTDTSYMIIIEYRRRRLESSFTSKMANRTVSDAKTVKGTNPQYLVEKIIRSRIYESKYWKEQCFALSGMLVDKFISG